VQGVMARTGSRDIRGRRRHGYGLSEIEKAVEEVCGVGLVKLRVAQYICGVGCVYTAASAFKGLF
jgi:hypothetical protein